jgi:hypothetical protein
VLRHGPTRGFVEVEDLVGDLSERAMALRGPRFTLESGRSRL